MLSDLYSCKRPSLEVNKQKDNLPLVHLSQLLSPYSHLPLHAHYLLTSPGSLTSKPLPLPLSPSLSHLPFLPSHLRRYLPVTHPLPPRCLPVTSPFPPRSSPLPPRYLPVTPP